MKDRRLVMDMLVCYRGSARLAIIRLCVVYHDKLPVGREMCCQSFSHAIDRFNVVIGLCTLDEETSIFL